MNSSLVNLEEIAEFINGRAFKPSDWSDSGLPIIRIQNLTGTNETFNYFNGPIDDRVRVRKDDILISWSASLGVYRWQGKDAALNQHIFKVQLNEGIYRDYFYYAATNAVQDMLTRVHGSTMQHITKERFDSIQIRLPDLSEQRRIAGRLEQADRLRRTRRYALELTDTLLPAAFLELFGDPVRNTGGWPVQVLSEVGEVQGGVQLGAKRNALLLKKPYLRVANVQRGFIDLSEVKQIGLTEAEFHRTALQKDDLLLVEGNGNPQEVGRAGRWDGSIPDCVHQNHLIRVRCNAGEILPLYLIALLNGARGMDYYLKRGRTTSGLVTISTGLVNDFPALVPPLPLQQKFAALVERVERLRAVQRESLRQAEHLFASLLHRAFAA